MPSDSPASSGLLLDLPLYDTANPQDSSDFDRFQVMLAKKSRRDAVRKAHFKERKAAA